MPGSPRTLNRTAPGLRFHPVTPVNPVNPACSSGSIRAFQNCRVQPWAIIDATAASSIAITYPNLLLYLLDPQQSPIDFEFRFCTSNLELSRYDSVSCTK